MFNSLNLSRGLKLQAVLKCRSLYVKSTRNLITNSSKNYLNSVASRKFVAEYRGVLCLLRRSGIQNAHRCFATSGRRSNKESQDPNKKPEKDEEDGKMSNLIGKAFLWILSAYMLTVFISLMFPSTSQPEFVRFVSWNEFLHHMLAKGEVEQIIVRPDVNIVTIILTDGAIIKGKKVEHKMFHMNVLDVQKFEEKLREAETRLGIKPGAGVPVIFERSSDTAGKLLASLIVAGLLLSLLSRGKGFRNPISFDTFSQMGRAKFTLVDPLTGPGKGVKFEDVAGLKEAKIEVMEFVDYLKKPEHYQNLGAKVPKGALLLGPPGCGKTLLAKAVATEANVPFLSMNGSEFIEMIGGLGAARVRDLFKEAKKRSPCIIYIDEIDAIGKKRSSTVGGGDGGSGEGDQTLNQLLVEMDGMAGRQGVLLLASTNRADVLDSALLRPGRFDRHILIDLPNIEERTEIFERHLSKLRLEFSPKTYSKRLARLTPGCSGADIANICNESALLAARTAQKSVKASNLEMAIQRVLGGAEKRSTAVSPEERQIVAYHEAGHALMAWLLPYTDLLLKVSIVPRTSMALGFSQYAPTEQYLYTKEELMDRMCAALGGRVAESLTFNRVTTGAQNDLEKVTKMAYAQIKQFGMNSTVGLVSFPEEDSRETGKRPYSKKLAALMDIEAKKLVNETYKRTEKILLENQSKLEAIAQALLQKETLNYEDVESLIGPPSSSKKKTAGMELTEPYIDPTNPTRRKRESRRRAVPPVVIVYNSAATFFLKEMDKAKEKRKMASKLWRKNKRKTTSAIKPWQLHRLGKSKSSRRPIRGTKK